MILKMMFILFLGLKLTNFINWAWWLISAPLILLFIRWLIIEIIKECVRQKYNWAIKFIKWVKS